MISDMRWQEDTTSDNPKYDLIIYEEEYEVGSIININGDWYSDIDDRDELLLHETLQEAKEEFMCRFREHCEDQINYYHELERKLDEMEAATNDK